MTVTTPTTPATSRTSGNHDLAHQHQRAAWNRLWRILLSAECPAPQPAPDAGAEGGAG